MADRGGICWMMGICYVYWKIPNFILGLVLALEDVCGQFRGSIGFRSTLETKQPIK